MSKLKKDSILRILIITINCVSNIEITDSVKDIRAVILNKIDIRNVIIMH